MKMDKTSKAAVHYAPVQQEMRDEGDVWLSPKDIQEWKQRLDAKEAELEAVQQRLQHQQHLMQLSAKAKVSPAGTSTQDSEPDLMQQQQQQQQEGALLLARWQCLLEERKQITALLQLSKDRLRDFEPGETPMRDVTCAVITHQLDTPCLSCCFQR